MYGGMPEEPAAAVVEEELPFPGRQMHFPCGGLGKYLHG